ncbi:glycosyltransferase [Cecembia lonarensis]|uniref:D-inositol-3-phosphate glycosyltransferase n=1 Tax=Cecembia lonarensis (strain CCUG 58316 / KCTC 22772 / LW9) TaxID=1225176 RepID=K1LX23_CECL9|nr:glycosyltransferase [Cecembia lonarensis]EKB48709.1 D-inositol-3-phosphate glycosyltransferase [Cecembia lonarensis LW9]
MKIIRIVTELDFGGVEKHMELTADGMLNYPDFQMIFLALGKGGQTSKLLSSMGFQVIVLNENPQIPNFQLIRKLVRIFKGEKPDVVHCSNGEGNFHGIWAAWWAGVPLRIGEEVGFPNHHSYWKHIFRLTYTRANKIIAISQAVKDVLINLGEASDRKVDVIYYPMGKPKLELTEEEKEKTDTLIKQLKGQANKEQFVFITTCRLVAIKNLDGLINALASLQGEIKERELHFWIIGEGPEKDNLKTLSRNLGIDSQVQFLGFHANVNPFLMAADAFILPSFSEGFSLSLAEAMQLGLPSLATKVGGPSEIIKSHTGLLLDPNDHDDMVGQMKAMVEMDPDERRQMGLRGQEDVRKRFSVEIYAKALTEFYIKQLSLVK